MSTETVRYEPATTRSGPRRSSRWESFRDDVSFPMVIWLIHVLFVQLIATLSYRLGEIRSVRWDWGKMQYVPDHGPESGAYGMVRPPLEGWQHWIVEPFRNWDGTWYAMVAEQGYTPQFSAGAAFFPLYPWLMDIGSDLTGLPVETIGWAVSRLALLGALIMTYKLVRMDFTEAIARWTICALAIFPTALFFSAVYTESLFLFLAVTTLWAARKNDWLLAVLACLLATLTRSAGMMLGFPLAVLFIQQHGWHPKNWFPKALLAVIPVLGIGIFGWVLERSNLQFFSWQEQQWQWNRFSALPHRTFQCVFQGCEETVRGFNGPYDTTVHPVSFAWIGDALDHRLAWSYITSTEFRYAAGQSQVMDVVVTIVAFIIILIGLKKLPLYYSAWTIPPMLVPLFAPSSVFPLMSMPRFVLPLIPLFVMAVLLVYPHRKLAYGLAGVSIVLLAILTSQFALWYWVS